MLIIYLTIGLCVLGCVSNFHQPYYFQIGSTAMQEYYGTSVAEMASSSYEGHEQLQKTQQQQQQHGSESPDARLVELMSGMQSPPAATIDPNSMSLVELISAQEWRHCMTKLESSSSEAKVKQIITLGVDDEHKTKGYPLHMAVSKKPPVSQQA